MAASQSLTLKARWLALWSGLKRKPRQKVSVNQWLIDASKKALPSLAADIHLKELIHRLRTTEADKEREVYKRQSDVNDHICQILIDYLRRVRIRTMIIRADTSLEGDKLHCILTLESRGRIVTRYLELKT